MASDSPTRRISERLPISGRRFGLAVGATLVIAGLAMGAYELGLISVPTDTTEMAGSLIRDYGFPALFLVFVIEGAMLLYFAPSESLVPAAVIVLAETPADIGVILAIAVVGATIGQTALFLVAHRGGREYLLQKRWFRLGEDRLDRFDAWFQRWGPLAVPTSNTMFFTRGMLTVPAGLSEMDWRVFAVLSAIGTLSFEAILAGITLVVVGQ